MNEVAENRKHIMYELHLPKGIEVGGEIDIAIKQVVEQIIEFHTLNETEIELVKKLVVE